MNWRYIKDLLKNSFFEEFTGIDQIVNPDEYSDTGKVGEQMSYRALWYYFDNRLFRNIYIRNESGKLTEIDLVGVGRRGIYVFESKNYSGHIYGDGKYSKWLCYAGKKKYDFYSPILQNESHIKALRCYFDEVTPNVLHYFSVIIFSARCKVGVKNTGDSIVLKRDTKYNDDLGKGLESAMKDYPEVLTDQEIEDLCVLLKKAQRPDDAVKEEHLNNVIQSNNQKIRLR